MRTFEQAIWLGLYPAAASSSARWWPCMRCPAFHLQGLKTRGAGLLDW